MPFDRLLRRRTWRPVLAAAAAVLAIGAGPARALDCGAAPAPPAGALDAVDARLRGGDIALRWAVQAGSPVEAAGKVGCPVRIAAADGVPAFEVDLRGSEGVAPSVAPPPADGRLLVMADTHGEYAIAVQLLQRNGVLDDRLGWAFGRGTLVVTGDVLDRGAHQTELLWLFYRLQAEAAAAGGQVHLLLGNHEAMVMRGDLRYLNPKYARVAEALGLDSYAAALGPETVLGQWLRTRPAMLRIGDDLFLHGGVSPAFVEAGLDLDRANAVVRASLDAPRGAEAALAPADRLVTGSDGPLWYRGYFPRENGSAAVDAAGLDAILSRLGVKRIFVGHTPVDHVAALFGGRVIAVQVYPHRDDAGRAVMEAVLVEGDRLTRVQADGAPEPLTP